MYVFGRWSVCDVPSSASVLQMVHIEEFLQMVVGNEHEEETRQPEVGKLDQLAVQEALMETNLKTRRLKEVSDRMEEY